MSEIVSIVLLAVFVLLFLLALLAALAGFIKGLYKTTVKTILVAVLLCVFIFLTPSITEAIGNIDLSSFGFSFTFNGETIALTSIQETLANVITATGLISPMNGISIYQTAIALANSLLAYVIFFVMVLLTQLFIWLLTAIVYNGIFRWFLPVETSSQRRERKELSREKRLLTQGMYFDEEEDEAPEEEPEVIDPYRQEELLRGQENLPGQAYAEPFAEDEDEDSEDRIEDDETFDEVDTRARLPLLRFPGAILGACCEFVLAMVLVSPFTALARTALDHKDTLITVLSDANLDIDTEGLSTSLDTMDDSLLFRLLGFSSFDTTIMDKVSQVEIGGEKVSFNSLLSSALDIASPLIDNGALTFDNGVTNVTINFAILLSDTMVDSLIDTIVANPIVMALIPPAIDIGVNYVSSANLPLDELDLSDIDWENQLESLATIYANIYQTTDANGEPILSSLFAEGGTKLTLENFKIPTSKASIDDATFQKNLEKYASALHSLGELDVVDKNLPMILSSLGTYLNSIGYDVLPTDADDYADIDWAHDFEVLGTNVLRIFRLFDLDVSMDVDFTSAIKNLSQDSFETAEEAQAFVTGLKEAFCGGFDEQGKAFDGLLSCSLFDVLHIGDFVKNILENVPALSNYIDSIDFSLLDNMDATERIAEFGALFDILNTLLSPDFSIDFQKGFSGIDFSSQEVADDLVMVLEQAQNSELFNKMYPSIVKSLLNNPDLKLSDRLFGLSPYDLNFEDENFTADFKELISYLPKVYSLYSTLTSSGSNEEKLASIDDETFDALGGLLEIIAGSDFFNPSLSTGVGGMDKGRNFNIHVLLSNLFQQDVFQDMGLVAPSLETLSKIDLTQPDPEDPQGRSEIEKIVALLKDAKRNASFLLNGGTGDIEDEDALKSMLETGLDSKLLEPSILAIIDDSMNSFLEELGIHKTFNQMRTEMWKEDIDLLADILALAGGMDFDDPDFFSNVDIDKLNALLTTLYRTNFVANCFGTPLKGNESEDSIARQRNDNFSSLFVALIQNQDLFGELGIENFNYGALYVETWSNLATLKNVTIDGKEYAITQNGDIRGLCDFFTAVQKAGMEDLKNGNLPENFLNEITRESKESKVVMSLLSTILANGVENLDMLDSFKNAIQGIDFYRLVGMDANQISKEFAFIQDIYDLSRVEDGEEYSDLDNMFTNIFNMTPEQQDQFTSLLEAMGESELMTTVRDGQNRAPVAELLYQIFVENGSGEDSLLSQLTLSDNEDDFNSLYNGLVSQVDSWLVELRNFDSVIRTFSELGIRDVSSISDIFGNADMDDVKTLLKLMNGSAIFHRLPISVFRDNIQGSDSGMASLFKDPDTGVVKTIDFCVHLSNSEEDVAYWNNEIEHAVNILSSVSPYLETGFDNVGIKTEENPDGIDLAILYDIGSMDLFKNVRSYLVYNLVYNSAPDSAKTEVQAVFKDVFVYGENPDAFRIETLFFRNPELLDENGNLIKEKVELDVKALSSILMSILDQLDTFAGSEDIDALFPEGSLAVSFQKLTNDVFYEYNGKVCRSALASELIAGSMQMIFKNPTILDMTSAVNPDFAGFGFVEDDFYGTSLDYPMVNPIEGTAIDTFFNALYELYSNLQQGNYGFAFTSEQMSQILKGLSIDISNTDTGSFYLFFADQYEQNGEVNSRFASDPSIQDILNLLPVETTEGRKSLEDILGADFDPQVDAYLERFEEAMGMGE